MIGKLRSVVVDTRDPLALATFWAGVLGGRVMTDEDENDDTWVVVTDPTGRRLAFQLAPQHEPPTFPDPHGSQQFHLDILVDDDRSRGAGGAGAGGHQGRRRTGRGNVPRFPRSCRSPVLLGVGRAGLLGPLEITGAPTIADLE